MLIDILTVVAVFFILYTAIVGVADLVLHSVSSYYWDKWYKKSNEALRAKDHDLAHYALKRARRVERIYDRTMRVLLFEWVR